MHKASDQLFHIQSHLSPTTATLKAKYYYFHPHLQTYKLRPGEVKQLAQGHKAMLSVLFKNVNHDSLANIE